MSPYRENLTLPDEPPPWWMRWFVYVLAWMTGPALTGPVTVTWRGHVREFHLDFDRRGRPSVVGLVTAAAALEARAGEFGDRWRASGPDHELDVLARLAQEPRKDLRWSLVLAWAKQQETQERLRAQAGRLEALEGHAKVPPS